MYFKNFISQSCNESACFPQLSSNLSSISKPQELFKYNDYVGKSKIIIIKINENKIIFTVKFFVPQAFY